jgi:hypothetical protein
MIYSVVVYPGASVSSLVTLREDGAAPDPPAGWRFVATTDDRTEALRWLELLRKECAQAPPAEPTAPARVALRPATTHPKVR